MNNYTFTVFTPTFNRAHTLFRVYESLRNQTYKDFEWLIVDDGSDDNTYELVKNWKEEADFPIHYFWQENRGKHIAFNKGVKEAKGEFFLPLDSDDACVPEALERFKYYWDSIPKDKKNYYTGVCALCKDQYGNLIGNPFPYNPTDSDSLEIYYKFKIRGEKWGFNRTEILKCFPFPEDENMKFILEGFIWYKIAKFYKTRFVNEILRIYYIQDSKDSDQLSRSLGDIRETIKKKYAIGASIYYEFLLNNNINWFKFKPIEFFIYGINSVRFSLHSRRKFKNILQGVKTLKGKIIILITLPIAMFIYFCESKNIFIINKINRKLRNLLKVIK